MMTSKRTWIREHRSEIDAIIRASNYHGSINDGDREDWIANHEGLYHWARGDGVSI